VHLQVYGWLGCFLHFFCARANHYGRTREGGGHSGTHQKFAAACQLSDYISAGFEPACGKASRKNYFRQDVMELKPHCQRVNLLAHEN